MVRRIIRDHGRKLLRYAGVSCIGVLTGQTLLFLFYNRAGLDAVAANSLAVALATIPSYVLNRAWVWGKTGSHRVATEILPFWGMAFLGLFLSNVLVHLAEQRSDWWVMINGANLAAFAALWVAKYILLDRVLFVAEPTPTVDAIENAA